MTKWTYLKKNVFNKRKSYNVIYHLNRLKKPHYHLSKVEKALDPIKTPIHDKNSQQIKNKMKFPQFNKRHP